jgi:hypothetical protein
MSDFGLRIQRHRAQRTAQRVEVVTHRFTDAPAHRFLSHVIEIHPHVNIVKGCRVQKRTVELRKGHAAVDR